MAQEPCPHCGKEFDHDNVGARTQHVNTCGSESESTQNERGASADGGQSGGIQRRQSGRGGVPAQSSDGPQMGAVGGVLAATDDNLDAQTRTQGAMAALGSVGQALGQLFQFQEQKQEAADAKAQQAELTRADQYPTCETDGCDYTFTGEDVALNSDMVTCPECGAAYEVELPSLD